METKNHYQKHIRNKLIFGGVIIAIGAVLLGLNFGLIPQSVKPILISWQALIVLWGVVSLFRARFFKGIILLAAGGFFLVPRLQTAFPEQFAWAGNDFLHTYYPLLLIAGGVLLIIYWLLPDKCRKNRHFWHYSYVKTGHECTCGDNCTCEKCNCEKCNCEKDKKSKKCNCTLDKNVIFAGSDEIYLEEVFRGGEINTIFGGVNLDLRRTTLPEGETVLELNAVLGGIKLYVPNTWYVEIRANNVCAGFVDNRDVVPENIDKTRKLIIVGSFVCGGGEISN
jgi:predicted membrane protein